MKGRAGENPAGLFRARGPPGAYDLIVSQAWKLRIGWIVVACLAALIVAAGVFVLPVLLPDKPTSYRAETAGAAVSVPVPEPTVATRPTAPPSTQTSAPAAAPLPPPPLAAPETAVPRITERPLPPANVPARVTAPQPSPAPALPVCPIPSQVTMRLTSVSVVASPLAIYGAAGLDFMGVFENTSDVPVYIQRGELFAYTGRPPQSGLATKVTFFEGGGVPAHGALTFNLDTIVDSNGGVSRGLTWHVADNSRTVQYMVATPTGASYTCGQATEGRPLTW